MAIAPRNRRDADDTIYALSSGSPPAAIAIVRVSGPAAGATLAALAGRLPPPRHARLAHLRDEHGDTLDHALTLWFPGPRSATGEDLAELHLHGGRAIVAAVLAALERRGLRLAEPGEFTRRALFNGRLDLGAAEGLADLLAAETETQRREALLRADGALGRRLRGWADRLVALCAAAEAAIDYDEEVHDPGAALMADIEALHAEIAAALARPPAERLRDGVRVAIVGPANAGKSSLFNALLGQAAAIVSAEPGTTRDAIERSVALGGVPLVLIDTAGEREGGGAIEREGIARARHVAATADLLLDLSPGARSDERRLAIGAKADLRPPANGIIAVSSITGEGVAALADALVARAKHLVPQVGEVAWDRRYRNVLATVAERLASALASGDSVLAADDLRAARAAMDALIGGADLDAVLDALFGRFCLGK